MTQATADEGVRIPVHALIVTLSCEFVDIVRLPGMEKLTPKLPFQRALRCSDVTLKEPRQSANRSPNRCVPETVTLSLSPGRR